MNPQCCLRVLVLNKCRLGLAGIIKIVQALAGNASLEELNLAENVVNDKDSNSQPDTAQKLNPKCIHLNSCDSNPKNISQEEVGNVAVNSECNHLEVADSEEDLMKAEPILDDSATSSCRRSTTPHPESQLFQELSTVIGMAQHLQLLDLSSNGFTEDTTETLYTAWSSTLRSGCSAQRHVKEQVVHFLVDGKNCCGFELCCKKDL